VKKPNKKSQEQPVDVKPAVVKKKLKAVKVLNNFTRSYEIKFIEEDANS
jgi:hypothetical protein